MRYFRPFAAALFWTFSMFQTYGQESKPTKEATFIFLKENFFSKEIIHLDYYHRNTSFWERWLYVYEFLPSSVVLTDCTLKLSYSTVRESSASDSEKKTEKKGDFQLAVDFSRVESITISSSVRLKKDTTPDDVTKGNQLLELVFREQAASGKVTEKRIPIASLDEADIASFEENNKSYKAFKYLRKVCGGPEPIKFD